MPWTEVRTTSGRLLAQVSSGGPMTTVEVAAGLQRFTAYVEWPSWPEPEDDPGGSTTIELDAVDEYCARQCVARELKHYIDGANVRCVEPTPWWPSWLPVTTRRR